MTAEMVMEGKRASSKPTFTAEPPSPTYNAAKAKQKPVFVEVDGDADQHDTNGALLSQEEKDAAFAIELAAQEAEMSVAGYRSRIEGDEDLARRLHNEWSG